MSVLGSAPLPTRSRLVFFRTRGNKCLVNTSLNITTLDGKTCLPGVDERSPNRAAGGNVHIGVVEDEHRIFPAQFEDHRKQSGAGSLRNSATVPHTAG